MPVEAQGIFARQIGLGGVEFLGRDAFGRHARPFGADDLDRLGDAVVGRRHAAHVDGGQVLGQEVGIDAIGQAALFADFRHQAAFEPAAAQDMIQHEGGEEIGVVAFVSHVAEDRDGLRRVEGHDGDTPFDADGGRPGDGRAGLGQIAQQVVQQHAQFFRGDVAHGAHEHPVARQRAAMGGDQIVAGQGGDALQRPLAVAGVGVIAIGHPGEGGTGDVVRIGQVGPQARQHLLAHPFDGVGVEAGLGQGQFQHRRRLIAVFGQEAGRDRDVVIRRVVVDRGRQRFQRPRIGARVQIARAFFQKAGHQVGRATRAFRIQRGAAPEPQFQRHEGDRMILDQPGPDPAGRGDLADLHPGPGRDRGDQGDDGRQNTHHHCIASSACISQPVTDPSRRRTARAASTTSSAVTACSTSGQAFTSSTVSPLVSAWP